MKTQRWIAALIPNEKCGVCLDIKKNFFAYDKHSRLSSGTSNAIYNWWSLIERRYEATALTALTATTATTAMTAKVMSEQKVERSKMAEHSLPEVLLPNS